MAAILYSLRSKCCFFCKQIAKLFHSQLEKAEAPQLFILLISKHGPNVSNVLWWCRDLHRWQEEVVIKFTSQIKISTSPMALLSTLSFLPFFKCFSFSVFPLIFFVSSRSPLMSWVSWLFLAFCYAVLSSLSQSCIISASSQEFMLRFCRCEKIWWLTLTRLCIVVSNSHRCSTMIYIYSSAFLFW